MNGEFRVYNDATSSEKKGFEVFLVVFIMLISIVFEGCCIYRYVTNKPTPSIYFIIPVIIIILSIWGLCTSNKKKEYNKYKNGIRVMATVEEYESYFIRNKSTTRMASENITDYTRNGYEQQAYKVYVRATNPHTGNVMTCESNGFLHPIEGHNLKEIPVYFHKKNPKKYYVDVKEAIANKG